MKFYSTYYNTYIKECNSKFILYSHNYVTAHLFYILTIRKQIGKSHGKINYNTWEINYKLQRE